MSATYTYRLLDPRPAARQAELEFLASTPCLGVEVTVLELAAACQLGNLDPQHSGGDPGTSAIEAALSWPLPPAGTVLVTVRPDADAYGAMTVLAMRTEGWDLEPGTAAAERACRIGWDDRTASEWTPGEDVEAVTARQALAAACLATRDPEAGVSLVYDWLTTGEFPGQAEWADRVREERREHAAVAAEVTTAADGRIAVIKSTSRFAVTAAYQHADVVVAVNPAFRRPGAGPDEPEHRKVTICQRAEGHVDLPAVFAELSAREPGWGGSPTIGGSPQGTGCTLPTEEIAAAMQRHLTALNQPTPA